VEPTIRQRIARQFLLPSVVLLLLLAIGMTGYRWLENMTIVDSLYMVVITLSTVGFGEIQPLSPAGRLFTVTLIVGGVGLAAYTLGGLGTFLLSDEWRTYREHQRQGRMLAKLSNHTIICGYGRVGRRVAHDLHAENLPFVVIDHDPAEVAHCHEIGYLALEGNGANEAHLHQAGIGHARGLVATTGSDAENVFIVLTARGLRADLSILARANYEDSEAKLLRAGADRVILPSSIAGRRMVSMLVRPAVADFLDEVAHASGMELLLEQVHLLPGSSLVGQSLSRADVTGRLGLLVLAYKRPEGQLITNPDGGTVLQANAQLIALGTRDQLQALNKLARG
jgi:voltage-gated potassium channel